MTGPSTPRPRGDRDNTRPGGATTHRRDCDLPVWDVTASGAVRGLTVARCARCGAVELRRERTQ